MEFIDLDELIEQQQGMTITEIFATRGEAEFRRLEREALQEVATRRDCIVATGGGTPCRPGAMEFMNQRGTTVYLDPGIDSLHRRLCHGRATRPLIAAIDNDDDLRQFIKNRLDERSPHYNKATSRFDSSRLETPQEIAHTVQTFIDQYVIIPSTPANDPSSRL